MALIQQTLNKQPYYKENEKFWEKYGICFKLACLLHDCGHAPMSHSFEYAYLDPKSEADCIAKKEMLLDSMLGRAYSQEEADCPVVSSTRKDVEKYFADPRRVTPHEMVSAIVASLCFRTGIGNVLAVCLGRKLDDCELQECIIFIQRAIIGLHYGDLSGENYLQDSFKNCLISLLNGDFFDVDKLDYIVRDTIESGANNLSIDIPRILSALTLVETHHFDVDTKVEKLELNNSVYLKGCSEGRISDKSENSECECSLNLTGVYFKGYFQGEILADDDIQIKTANRNGRLSGEERFEEFTEMEVTVRGTCRLNGRFQGTMDITGHSEADKIEGMLNAKLSGTIKGIIIGHIDATAASRKTYEIGYLKTALSVIEDTLIARNRLYLWIYAHHKVAYNDYLLRQGILWSYLSEEDACLPELERMKKADMILTRNNCT